MTKQEREELAIYHAKRICPMCQQGFKLRKSKAIGAFCHEGTNTEYCFASPIINDEFVHKVPEKYEERGKVKPICKDDYPMLESLVKSSGINPDNPPKPERKTLTLT